MSHFDLGGADFEVKEGRKRKLIAGESLEFVVVEREAGAGDGHSHPNEQIVYFLEGNATFHIGEDNFEVGPGHAVRIPPNVKHGITPHSFIRYVTAYTPVRESTRREIQEGRPGHWSAT